MKIHIGDVKVIEGKLPAHGNAYRAEGLMGPRRRDALERFMRRGNYLGFQFWFVPNHGGAQRITSSDEIDWRSSGIMTKAEADAFDEAEAASCQQMCDAHQSCAAACSLLFGHRGKCDCRKPADDPGPPTVNVSTASITAADDDVEDETVEAPTLSVHQETDTECSPAAPCGTCRRREEGVPVSGTEKTCPCAGLGYTIEFNDSRDNPSFGVHPCDEHPVGTDPANSVDMLEAAAERADACHEALAAIRDIMWPENPDDEIVTLAALKLELFERLAFLNPNRR